jgi:hypothetical protein
MLLLRVSSCASVLFHASAGKLTSRGKLRVLDRGAYTAKQQLGAPYLRSSDSTPAAILAGKKSSMTRSPPASATASYTLARPPIFLLIQELTRGYDCIQLSNAGRRCADEAWGTAVILERAAGMELNQAVGTDGVIWLSMRDIS